MLGMLLAYDSDGRVIATKAYHVVYDESHPDRPPLGIVDWGAMEEQGARFGTAPGRSSIGRWRVEGAVGSGYWPEWIGAEVHGFDVELNGDRIVALVHHESGYRRDRVKIEAAIQKRIEEAGGAPADIRDIVGGPTRPLELDRDTGRTRDRRAPVPVDVPLLKLP